MKHMTITEPQLKAALLSWEQAARDGKTRSHDEANALSLEQVSAESAAHLWALLGAAVAVDAMPDDAGFGLRSSCAYLGAPCARKGCATGCHALALCGEVVQLRAALALPHAWSAVEAVAAAQAAGFAGTHWSMGPEELVHLLNMVHARPNVRGEA